jgi:predicted glycosyltransferase
MVDALGPDPLRLADHRQLRFPRRVDFVRVPGVIKLRNGEYTSLNLHIDIEETLAMRASIIQHTADIFDPDLFIVDKEPLGLRGEVAGNAEMLKARGVPLILGLRDVMDEPGLLAPEWERKNVVPALPTSTTTSGSTACRRSATRWRASRCRPRCARR